MIYLDSNATTATDPRVLEVMLPFFTRHYANPSASYAGARVVRRAVVKAREQVAALLDCHPEEIVFTSGGTESNNAVIDSAMTMAQAHPAHLVTARTEHSAVIEPAERWSREGRRVSLIGVSTEGLADQDELSQRLRESGPGALVSLMWGNNETGVLAPMDRIAQLCHEQGALLHSDAVQVVGKQCLSLRETPVDYLSLSGHKFHGPKGIGALYVSRRVRFRPWFLGGGQESGRRSGTENIPGLVGLGQAAELMRLSLESGGAERVREMRDAFEAAVLAALPETRVNGSRGHRLASTSSLTFPGVEAAGLLILLDEKGVACSAGSACHAGALHPSHVLEAMGYDAAHARCTLRFSWSHLNTLEETQQAAEATIAAVRKMQALHSGSGPVVVMG